MVRAKFVCEKKDSNTQDEIAGTVALRAVYEGSPENKEFFSMTPAGTISLSTVNGEAYQQFEKGKEYYVDFTPAN